MKNRDQIFIIHGGMTFKSKKDYLSFLKDRKVSVEKKVSWSTEWLDKRLGKEYEIIRPRMPLQDDAKYKEWKIHFERFIPFLKNNVVLVGSSLGGTFLAKYLSEHKFPKKIKGVFLICAPFDNTVVGEDLVGGFTLKADLSQLEKSTKNLYLLFSEDDDIVPVSHAEKYRRKLNGANIVIYKNKNGHFKIAEFPEIVKMIKNLKKRK